VAVAGTASALLVVSDPTARADVALCRSFPTPSSEAEALRRAPFAFDGVAVGGRRIVGSGGALISPLTFRVIRWIKGDRSHGVVLSSGVERIQLWDGRYARLPDRLLESYSRRLQARFPGEIVARRGQRWRVYATNESGVNFTCTNLLGSHLLESPDAASATARAGAMPPPRGSPARTRSDLPAILVLVGAGVAALLAWVVTRRGRRNASQP
jgi:hypothetical protein